MLFAIVIQAAFPFTSTGVCQAEAVAVVVQVLVQSATGDDENRWHELGQLAGKK